jgi:inositol transport system substrate-binding protein
MVMGHQRARRTLAVVASAISLLVVASGCGSSKDSSSTTSSNGSANKKQLTIGMADYNTGNAYHARLDKAAQDEAKTLGVKLVLLPGNTDLAKESTNMDTLISQHVDAIVMDPQSASSSLAPIARAQRGKIPVITVCDNVNSKTIPYVGSNYVADAGGEIAAQGLAKLPRGNGNVVFLEGALGPEVTTYRHDAVVNAVKQNGMHLVFNKNGDWSAAGGAKLMQDAMTRLPKPGQINLMVAANDDTALGAIRALEQRHRLSQVKVAAIDGSQAGLQAVTTGKMAFTVFQDAEAQGRGAVKAAVDAANGKTVPARINIPWTLVDSKAKAQDMLKSVYGA